MKQYIAELNKLPRDLPIDGRTGYITFVRIFGLAAPDGTPDPSRMKSFASEWLEYITTIPVTSFDIPLVKPAAPKKTDDNNNQYPMPGMPGFPNKGGRNN